MDRLARETVAPETLLAEAPDLAREILADLRADYDPQVNAEREWYAPKHHDPDATAPDGLYRYASVWCRRDGAVLLVRPAYDDGWCGPGGTWEPGESLAVTAEEWGQNAPLAGLIERLRWRVGPERPRPGASPGGAREPAEVSAAPPEASRLAARPTTPGTS